MNELGISATIVVLRVWALVSASSSSRLFQSRWEGKPRARLFVVSGPSGCRKRNCASKVRELRPDLGLTVSATTREPRAGEVDGRLISLFVRS